MLWGNQYCNTPPPPPPPPSNNPPGYKNSRRKTASTHMHDNTVSQGTGGAGGVGSDPNRVQAFSTDASNAPCRPASSSNSFFSPCGEAAALGPGGSTSSLNVNAPVFFPAAPCEITSNKRAREQDPPPCCPPDPPPPTDSPPLWAWSPCPPNSPVIFQDALGTLRPSALPKNVGRIRKLGKCVNLLLNMIILAFRIPTTLMGRRRR